MRNQAQLIAFADRLAGDLASIRALLTGPIDGADAGYPVDHRAVDERLGSWDDVQGPTRADAHRPQRRRASA